MFLNTLIVQQYKEWYETKPNIMNLVQGIQSFPDSK